VTFTPLPHHYASPVQLPGQQPMFSDALRSAVLLWRSNARVSQIYVPVPYTDRTYCAVTLTDRVVTMNGCPSCHPFSRTDGPIVCCELAVIVRPRNWLTHFTVDVTTQPNSTEVSAVCRSSVRLSDSRMSKRYIWRETDICRKYSLGGGV